MTQTRIELQLLQHLDEMQKQDQRYFFINAWDALVKITGMTPPDAAAIIGAFIYDKKFVKHDFENASSIQIIENEGAVYLFVTTDMDFDRARVFLKSHAIDSVNVKTKHATPPFCKALLSRID